jgi:hypothetical protein
MVCDLEFIPFEADDDEAFRGAFHFGRFWVAVFLRRRAHENGIAFPLVASVGVFVAVEDEDDIIGSDDGLEIFEILGFPPFFESPSAQAVMPEKDHRASAFPYVFYEVCAKEIEAFTRIIPRGRIIVNRTWFVTGKKIEVDEVERSPVP